MTRNDIRLLARANNWHVLGSSTTDSCDRKGVIVVMHWTSKGIFKTATRVGDSLSGIGEAFTPTRERTTDIADIEKWLEAV
jgi:hypothetical protein